MATLDDILATQKNGVIAINNLSSRMQYLQGSSTSGALTSSTTVFNSGSGRLVRVSVIVAGSAAGTVYVGSVSAANAVYSIPNTVGIHDVGIQLSGPLIIVPGTGQTVSVTYSRD